MSPAAEAQPAPEASGEGQEALAESKARSVISYSPEEIFQKSWQTYQLVVDAGLLGHAKLASAVASQLAELRRTRGRPLRILDLGSGDAGSLTRALAAEAARLSSAAASASPASAAADFVSQYTGVDDSRPALALAAENVEKNLPGTEGRFFAGDLLSAAEQSGEGKGGASAAAAATAAATAAGPSGSLPAPPEGGYDAIVASLSAHHLSTEEGKPALVAAARRALLPAGGEEEKGASGGAPTSPSPGSSRSSLLIIADVFLNEDGDGGGDTVDAWRRRSCAVIRERWPLRVAGGALSAEEAHRIASHVGTCDVPAKVSEYAAFAEAAGFRRCAKVADVEEELGIKVIVLEI